MSRMSRKKKGIEGIEGRKEGRKEGRHGRKEGRKN